MTRGNFLTGLVTLLLLSLIIVLVVWSPENSTSTAIAKNQTAEKHSTASLQHFSLADMVASSERIFRGTVVDLKSGTVNVGGADLPTTTYRMLVEHSFKGTFASKGDVQYVEIKMLGSIKDVGASQGEFKRMPVLPTPPRLEVGSDYLLLLTPESSVGLTAPIGLGQGSFEIYTQDKIEWARNEYKNAGLYQGPVQYDELAAQIQQGGK